eukprot:14132244-Heterocapsa_arctica.AAC.1
MVGERSLVDRGVEGSDQGNPRAKASRLSFPSLVKGLRTNQDSQVLRLASDDDALDAQLFESFAKLEVGAAREVQHLGLLE